MKALLFIITFLLGVGLFGSDNITASDFLNPQKMSRIFTLELKRDFQITFRQAEQDINAIERSFKLSAFYRQTLRPWMDNTYTSPHNRKFLGFKMPSPS